MNRFRAAVTGLFDELDFPHDAFYLNHAFGSRPIILYGAGECCHWFVEIVMKMHGYLPVAILDQTLKRGQSYHGIPAFSPQDYRPTEEEKRDAIVVICVGNTEYHAEITNTLKVLGFRNSMFLLDVYEVHNPFSLPEALRRKGFSYFLGQKEAITGCLELFEDDESLEVYTRCLQTHMRRKPVPLPMRPKKEQYFPADIKLSRGYRRFVNCGAYDGDTVRLLSENLGKVESIVCFEPEPKIFARLVGYLSQHHAELAENIWSLPCAVYDGEAITPFVSSSGLGSRIALEGDSTVQCVAMDHVLHGFDPTFICMDVEGVEPEALKGAEAIIRANRPDLAICVYHAPQHLWEIPLYLSSLKLGYRLYLRNYTTYTGETVLYATA